MKKFMVFLMVLTLFPWNAFAACEWKTGISLLPDGAYRYSKECHIRVGETVRDLEIAKKQVKLLNESLTLKDLALTKANERADLWMDTSFKLEKRVETMDSLYQRNKWLYFGLGVLATSAVIYGASQLQR